MLYEDSEIKVLGQKSRFEFMPMAGSRVFRGERRIMKRVVEADIEDFFRGSFLNLERSSLTPSTAENLRLYYQNTVTFQFCGTWQAVNGAMVNTVCNYEEGTRTQIGVDCFRECSDITKYPCTIAYMRYIAHGDDAEVFSVSVKNYDGAIETLQIFLKNGLFTTANIVDMNNTPLPPWSELQEAVHWADVHLLLKGSLKYRMQFCDTLKDIVMHNELPANVLR